MLHNVSEFKGCRPIFVQAIFATIYDANDDWVTDTIDCFEFREPFYATFDEVREEAEYIVEGLEGWILDEVSFNNYVIDGNTGAIIYECADEDVAEMYNYYSSYGETLMQ